MSKDIFDLMETDETLEPGFQRDLTEQQLGVYVNAVNKFMKMSTAKRRVIMEEGRRGIAYLTEGAETTSDFSNLFGTVLDRTLLAKYQIQRPDVFGYVKKGTQRDFRAQNIIGVFGLQGNLPQVPEQGSYKAKALADGKVSCTVSKFGRIFPLSWESLINDDLGAFSDAADRLANAATRTEIYQATKLIAVAAGPSTSLFGTALTHPIDGGTVANKGTSVLSATTLFDTLTLMRNQLDTDGEPIMIDRFTLVVPPNKYKAALEAVNPAALIAVGLSATNAKEVQTSWNATASQPIDVVQNPYLPILDTTHGTTTWYVFATLSNGAAVQLNFLTGHESPEICMRASDKVSLGGGGLISPMEGNFLNDSAQWRVRHIMGGAVIDPRMAYAQAATS
jgi:hypothetical protein